MDSITYEQAVHVKLEELELKVRNQINAKRRELRAVQKKRRAAWAALAKLKPTTK